jgi:hypothetical protein
MSLTSQVGSVTYFRDVLLVLFIRMFGSRGEQLCNLVPCVAVST